MFGFTYIESRNKKYKLHGTDDSTISGKDFIAQNQLIKKFDGDKVFYNNEKYLIILDGVIINKVELLKKAKIENWIYYIIQSYETQGESFFECFRGSFSGIIKDKEKGKTIIFSDHIGSKFLYYIKQEDFFFVTSFMPNAYSFMKENGIDYCMSREGAYMLLTFGYMLEDYTICEQVKKIFPGHYLVIENNKLIEKEFCRFTNHKENMSIDDAVEMIDSRFRKACKAEYEKDLEYSYKHFVNLSGGLDSRMTSLVGDDLGFKEQLNLTFSQSGYWDETIPQQIAEDYRHDWIFKNLDSGYWLLDFEEIIKMTGGNVLYYGQAHSNSLMKNLNTTPYGICHSGQLGDVFVGRTYAGNPVNGDFAPYKMGDRAYSRKLINKLEGVQLKYDYDNREIGVLYNRGFTGMNNGLVPLFRLTETFSPFLDIDFIKDCLKVPVFWNNKNIVYNTWIEKKYPEFLKYGWEALNGHKINEDKITILGREMYKDELKERIKQKALKIIGIKEKVSSLNKNSMNPIAYYIKTYPHVSCVLNKYVDDNIDSVPINELKNDIIALIKSGNGLEITQAITLIATSRLYFC